MASAQTVMEIMQSWIDKGKLTNNNFDKFICYWIAFNCYYANKTQIYGAERKMIHALKNDNECVDMFKEIYKNGAYSHLFAKLIEISPVYENIPNSNKNSSKLKKISFANIIETLYLVRCNLFHGSKAQEKDRDIEVIAAAAPILELIVEKFCSNFPNL